MHPMIGNLCSRPEGGVDHALLAALETDYSLDLLYDIAEIDYVGRSHRDAIQANIEHSQKDQT